MDVVAHLRHLRIAPRKVRLVIDLVRGLPVDRAIDQLTLLPKRSSLPILKLIKSAVANAEHNFNIDTKTLVVSSIQANEGPKLKRWMPKAFGRANPILKRTSHVTVVLTGVQSKKPKAVKEEKPAKVDLAEVKQEPAVADAGPADKKVTTKKSATAKPRARKAQDATVARKGEE
jgi:large subunit ribosomal protein L22